MISTLLNKEEILKEFQIILALEEEAAWAYQQLAQDCDDPVAQRLLQEIAKEESAHVVIAQKLVKIVSSQILSHTDSSTKPI